MPARLERVLAGQLSDGRGRGVGHDRLRESLGWPSIQQREAREVATRAGAGEQHRPIPCRSSISSASRNASQPQNGVRMARRSSTLMLPVVGGRLESGELMTAYAASSFMMLVIDSASCR